MADQQSTFVSLYNFYNTCGGRYSDFPENAFVLPEIFFARYLHGSKVPLAIQNILSYVIHESYYMMNRKTISGQQMFSGDDGQGRAATTSNHG